MRKCLSCGYCFQNAEWTCPECGKKPIRKRDFFLFSPELAIDSDGYEPAYFEESRRMAGSYWMIARAKLVIAMIRKFFPRVETYLEIGCSTGIMLDFVHHAFPALHLSGCEIYIEAMEHLPDSLQEVFIFQADARKLPFYQEFSLIGAYDVLEHIDEDQVVLNQMYQAVRPQGGILITVPQHPSLWSRRDEVLRHKRRYTRTELVEKVQKAGFRILIVTSFVSLLFPMMLIENLFQKKTKREYNPFNSLQVNPVLNSLLNIIFTIERGLIRTGLRFPAGGSLLVVAIRD